MDARIAGAGCVSSALRGEGPGERSEIWLPCVRDRSRILHYLLLLLCERVVGWGLICLFRVLARGGFKTGVGKAPPPCEVW